MEIDPGLVRAVQRDEPGAMQALIEASYPYVHRLCSRLMGDPGDAADATQEVFLRVMRSVVGFRGEAAYTTWLHRVTVNVCLTHLRRRGDVRARGQSSGRSAFAAPDSVDELVDVRSVEDQVLALDEFGTVASALRDLSEDERRVVILRDIDGLSTRQTAEALGITETAAKVRLHRAHARLRRAVGAGSGGER